MAQDMHPKTRKELHALIREVGPGILWLLAANLATMLMALSQGWSLAPLMWVYWGQSLIIGIFNWLRIRHLKQFSVTGLKINGKRIEEPTPAIKRWMTNFFAMHFGFFHLVYLIFLLVFLGEIPMETVLAAMVGVLLFGINHAASYRHHLRQDAASTPGIASMCFLPYVRVLPMHLVIFIAAIYGLESAMALFVFLLLKTLIDLIMHSMGVIDWSKSVTA